MGKELDLKIDKNSSNFTISWYPGHMAKAKREIEEKLRLVDIVFELIDARIPFSSKNPMVKEILKNKPRLIIMTKSDLADSGETKKWEEYYKEQGINVLCVNSIDGYNIKKIVPLSKEILKAQIEKDILRGLKPRPIRSMIIGIPNVGKSTLLNKLVGKKVALVGNKPGVTKAQQWVRLNKDLDLLDTPGVLWPKFDDEVVALNLAISGAIRDEILNIEDVGNRFFNFLKEYYPNEFSSRYNIDISLDNYEICDEIMKSRGNINNYDSCFNLVLQDFRNGRIARITLDRVYL